MPMYYLTAFNQSGEKLLDEPIEAKNADEAKKIGERILKEKNLSNHTHRLVSPEGQLLLFHI